MRLFLENLPQSIDTNSKQDYPVGHNSQGYRVAMAPFPKTSYLPHSTHFLFPLPQPWSLPSFNLYSKLTSSLKLSLINPTQC